MPQGALSAFAGQFEGLGWLRASVMTATPARITAVAAISSRRRDCCVTGAFCRFHAADPKC